jgi:hypothetical protein
VGTTTRDERLAERLRRRYEAGASIRALARETGRSEGWVRRRLVAGGVALRTRQPSWRRTRERLIATGALIPATRSRHDLPPPLVPLRDGRPLSEIVVAFRGGA